MLRREVISLVIFCLMIIGCFVEFAITSEPVWVANIILLPMCIMLLILQWLCKPLKEWLDESVGKKKSKLKKRAELSKHLKERTAHAIREFGHSITSNMKAIYWPKEDVFIILWCNKILMYSDSENCSSIKGISTRFTDQDLERFLDFVHDMVIESMPRATTKDSTEI